jgi:hypothetical protein
MPLGGPGIPRSGAGVSKKRGAMTKAFKRNTFKLANIDRRYGVSARNHTSPISLF